MHCELRIAPEQGGQQQQEQQKQQQQQQPTSNNTNYNIAGEDESSDQTGPLAVEIVFLVVFLVVLAAIILSGFSRYVYYKTWQGATAECVSFIDVQEPYRDERNISPHRDSVTDPFPGRFHASSSDPFVSVLEETAPTRKASRSPSALEPVEIC